MRAGRSAPGIAGDERSRDRHPRVNFTPRRRHTLQDDRHNEAPQSLEEFILDRFFPTFIDPHTGRKVNSEDCEP